MSNPNMPQPNPEEFRGVTREEAIHQLSRTITKAAMGEEGSPIAPVIDEAHRPRTDMTRIGEYDTATTEAKTHYNSGSGNTMDKLSFTKGSTLKDIDNYKSNEISIDARGRFAREDKFDKNGVKTNMEMSTRRILAADRLARHQYGLNKKDETRAA